MTRDGDRLSIARGGFALHCNLGERPAGAELSDVVLASLPLAGARELPPLGCALVRNAC